VYSILYYVTSRGSDILLAQFLFALLYLATLYAVFRLYVRSKIVPPYALIFMCCTSYRIHSIFVLRLFNDPVAVFFFFCALNFFCDEKWIIGNILFSFTTFFDSLELLLFITTRNVHGTTLNEMLELMLNIFMAKLLFEVYQIIFHNFMILHGEWNCCDIKRRVVACYCNLDELENGKPNFQQFSNAIKIFPKAS